jgi:hypothetical protein
MTMRVFNGRVWATIKMAYRSWCHPQNLCQTSSPAVTVPIDAITKLFRVRKP